MHGSIEAAGGVTGGVEPARYGRVAVALHWIIAALIVVNLLLGLFHDGFDRSVRGSVINLHKSIGFAVLGLTLFRIGWRLAHRPPPFDAALKRWEAALARTVHWLFYLLLLAMPLTGWLFTSTGERFNPTRFFWLFPIGRFPVAPSEAVHDVAESLHQWLGYAMIGLILLHVAGAAKHHFQGHRHLIGRMAPWLYRGA